MLTIIEHPSPNHSPRPAGVRVDTVIIHHTATSSDERGTRSAVGWLSATDSKASAHYVIGHDGRVYRLVQEDRTAWHAGESRFPWDTQKHKPGASLNPRSIGVELVNPGDGHTPFTEAQYRALKELLRDICARRVMYGPSGGNVSVRPVDGLQPAHMTILGHRDVACFGNGRLGRKPDPADNFDWDWVRAVLTARVA